jgi:hypothetical protein
MKGVIVISVIANNRGLFDNLLRLLLAVLANFFVVKFSIWESLFHYPGFPQYKFSLPE